MYLNTLLTVSKSNVALETISCIKVLKVKVLIVQENATVTVKLLYSDHIVLFSQLTNSFTKLFAL